jgi:hypothetical protein
MAFHITWGTHGARLHGSAKPHVDRDHNEYCQPFAPTDPQREREAHERMTGSVVHLTFRAAEIDRTSD